MSPEERDVVRIKHIYEVIILIIEFAEDYDEASFQSDKLVQSAVIRQFEIIGEATSSLSEQIKHRFSGIEWRLMKSFRNLLIHEYFRVDAAEVWYSVEYDIPILKQQIEKVLEEIDR